MKECEDLEKISPTSEFEPKISGSGALHSTQRPICLLTSPSLESFDKTVTYSQVKWKPFNSFNTRSEVLLYFQNNCMHGVCNYLIQKIWWANFINILILEYLKKADQFLGYCMKASLKALTFSICYNLSTSLS